MLFIIFSFLIIEVLIIEWFVLITAGLTLAVAGSMEKTHSLRKSLLFVSSSWTVQWRLKVGDMPYRKHAFTTAVQFPSETKKPYFWLWTIK